MNYTMVIHVASTFHTHNSFIECSIEAGILLSGYGIVSPSSPRGEFDSFPGRRERPNECRHTTIMMICSSLSTYPILRTSCMRRIAPSDPSLNQPSRQSQAACPERQNSSTTFFNLNISLNNQSLLSISLNTLLQPHLDSGLDAASKVN